MEEYFNCLVENKEKYGTFSVPITKEVKRIDKNGEEFTKIISYRNQFIDSARFMARSLSNLIDNLRKEFIKLNAKMSTIIQNSKRRKLKQRLRQLP